MARRAQRTKLEGVAVDMTETLAMINRALQMRGMQRGMMAAGAHILSKLATYPPAHPGSSYVRTGNLGRRWTMVGARGGLQVTIGNNTRYAPRVQGYGEQLDFFAERGWKTPYTVALNEERRIEEIVSYYVQQDL